jgi:hypothetical protein
VAPSVHLLVQYPQQHDVLSVAPEVEEMVLRLRPPDDRTEVDEAARVPAAEQIVSGSPQPRGIVFGLFGSQFWTE